MNGSRPIWLWFGGAALLGAGLIIGSRWSSTRAPDRFLHRPPAAAPPTPSTGESPKTSARSDVSTAAELSKVAGSVGQSLARLTALKVNPQDPRTLRVILLELERLRESGADALPAIRAFLATGQDADYDTMAGKSFRGGTVPADFSVPPSLRLGLLEVVKNIGGPLAEELLLRELQSTGRGVEVAYLGAVLQQISPEKYREPALSAARDLLAMPLTARAQNPLDRSDRDYLYGVLTAAGDKSLVAQAQTQLVLPNGQLDQGALRYLHQMLGDQVVSIASEAWQDPRVSADQREPLARLALAFVGTSTSAEQIYRLAIDDPNLSSNARKNLIEDLNETGFADPKHLKPADLPLIEKRLALIEQLAPRAKDRTNAAAFVEARKDLLNMRDTVLATVASIKK